MNGEVREDLTPEGDPIHVATMWLEFPEGDIAITMDTTRLDAAIARAITAIERLADHDR